MFKDIKGFEGLYQVNELGVVKSLGRYQQNHSKLQYKEEHEVGQTTKPNGYVKVVLYKNNQPKHLAVHRLVAETFIPNPENKLTVDHIDSVRDNNILSNLRWATMKEQLAYTLASGNRVTVGDKHIVTYIDGSTIECESIVDTARCLGCGRDAIRKIIHHKPSKIQRDLQIVSIIPIIED